MKSIRIENSKNPCQNHAENVATRNEVEKKNNNKQTNKSTSSDWHRAKQAAPAYSLDVDEDDSYAAAPLTGAGGYAAAPTAVEEAQPSYYDPSGPTYSTPGHTGYYYYYYPLKPNKFKLRMPSLSKVKTDRSPTSTSM